MRVILGFLLVSLALFVAIHPNLFDPSLVKAGSENVLGVSTEEGLLPVKTQSQFSEKIVESSVSVPFKTVYKDDPEVEAGIDTVLEEGKEGKKTTITKITYHLDEEYDREIVGTDIIPAQDRVISRGTKIVWKKIDIDGIVIKYWKKMRVYATHYDSKCPGCDDWTAIGMKAQKGVIAVDPKVIKMRTRMYVPGYGVGIAGDTGGAIKGNIIDLCFDDARTAGWRARFVDIYLLD